MAFLENLHFIIIQFSKEISRLYALLIKATKEFSVYILINQRMYIELKLNVWSAVNLVNEI